MIRIRFPRLPAAVCLCVTLLACDRGGDAAGGETTKLHEAIRQGDEPAARAAIDAGADVDAPAALRLGVDEFRDRDPREWLSSYLKYHQLLIAAIYTVDAMLCPEAYRDEQAQKQAEAIRELARDPKKLLRSETYSFVGQVTPLHLAALFCREAIARALLDAGAKVDAKDALGFTALHYAACRSMAELLVEKGAGVQARNSTGLTPLHVAIDRDVARFLIEKGADVHAKDDCGNTPLHIAADFGFAPRPRPRPDGTAGLEMKEGWIYRLLERLGRASEDLLVYLERYDVGSVLREKGADPTATNGAGRTAEELATRRESSAHDWDD